MIAQTHIPPTLQNPSGSTLGQLAAAYGQQLERMQHKSKYTFRAALCLHCIWNNNIDSDIECANSAIWVEDPVCAQWIQQTAANSTEEQIEELIDALSTQIREGIYAADTPLSEDEYETFFDPSNLA